MSKPLSKAPAATHQDVERLLGPLDTDAIMSVMALSPTLQDVEKAALYIAGEEDSVPEPHQPHGTVLAIIELVTRDEEDERRAR